MKFTATAIPEVMIIEPKVIRDERGFFMETFRADLFNEHCGQREFVQENHSKSTHGILRGLHFQTQNTQGKLIRVISGEIYDVAVDLRLDSPTFGQWIGVVLSAENKRQLWVPEGFAHGFYVMSQTAECMYKCTDIYNPKSAVSIMWNDPILKINWPLVDGELPSLSENDRQGITFEQAPKF